MLKPYYIEMLPDIRYCSYLKIMALHVKVNTQFFKMKHNVTVENTLTAPMLTMC